MGEEPWYFASTIFGIVGELVDLPQDVLRRLVAKNPSRWHLEGPISVKESTSNIAVYLRRATYLLAWEGRATKRNLDTLVSELMYNDISMLQRYEVVRSRSVPLLHFLPTSFEFAITISPLVR